MFSRAFDGYWRWWMSDRVVADFSTLKMTSHAAQSIPFRITTRLLSRPTWWGLWGGNTHTHAQTCMWDVYLHISSLETCCMCSLSTQPMSLSSARITVLWLHFERSFQQIKQRLSFHPNPVNLRSWNLDIFWILILKKVKVKVSFIVHSNKCTRQIEEIEKLRLSLTHGALSIKG